MASCCSALRLLLCRLALVEVSSDTLLSFSFLCITCTEGANSLRGAVREKVIVREMKEGGEAAAKEE